MFPITNGFSYLALLMFTAGAIKFAESRAKSGLARRFFTYAPAVVCLYLVTMAMGSAGLWEQTPEIRRLASGSSGVTAYLLPPMIFLLLLKSDLREIVKLGPRMIAVFVTAALTMMAGFVGGYALLAGRWSGEAWKSLAALCASWIGGNVNLVAVQGALGVPDADLSYVLTIDTVWYSLWLLAMLLAVPLARRFNRWTRADASELERVVEKLESAGSGNSGRVDFANLAFLAGLAMAAGALSFFLADWSATQCAGIAAGSRLLASLGEKPLWQVVYATCFGLGCGMTRLGRIPGSGELGNTLLFVFIAVIGAKVNLTQLSFNTMLVYLVFGLLVLAIHATLLALAAKLFRFDACSCQTASLANIGGIASATVISGAYSPSLVPIGVLMATLGTILGTGGGLVVGKILEAMQ